METIAQVSPKRVTLEAKIIRADGTVEELGTIASYDRRPWRRLIDRLRGLGKVEPR